jgi:hypothetical protein
MVQEIDSSPEHLEGVGHGSVLTAGVDSAAAPSMESQPLGASPKKKRRSAWVGSPGVITVSEKKQDLEALRHLI